MIGFIEYQMNDIERFMKKVNKTDSCWLWIAAKDSKGYGLYRARAAHRASYTLFNGIIPEGHVVRHKCDNPPCVNPEHLETGTQKENARDRTERGRTGPRLRGEDHEMSKLTYSDVVTMRDLRREGALLKDLSEKYGLTKTNIRSACIGRTWSHVPNPCIETPVGMRKTNIDDVKEIRILRGFGFELKELSEKFNLSIPTISNIINGDTWKSV